MMHGLIKTTAALLLAGAALSTLAPQPLLHAAQAVDGGASEGRDVARLTVYVTGAASEEGTVWIGLYAGQAAFESGDETASATLPADADGVEAVFDGLTPGAYGVIAFHDRNADGDFTRNFIGIPQERYGFSNNPRPRFRAADWDEAVFELDGVEERLEIELLGAGG